MGGIEIFGTLTESFDCPNGFLRNLGQFGLDSFTPNINNNSDDNDNDSDDNDKIRNRNEKINNNNKIIHKNGNKNGDENRKLDGNYDSSDESVVSYLNPSVNQDYSDSVSEHSTTSSTWNVPTGNVPENKNKNRKNFNQNTGSTGISNFPVNFGTSFKANIFPFKGTTGKKQSATASQNSEVDVNYNNDDDSDDNNNSIEIDDNNSFDNDENENDSSYKNNQSQLQIKTTTAIISTESFGNFQKDKTDFNNNIRHNNRKIKISSVENTEMEENPKMRNRPISPNISPLSRKNLEIHSNRDFSK